jgi:hypothetical protein
MGAEHELTSEENHLVTTLMVTVVDGECHNGIHGAHLTDGTLQCDNSAILTLDGSQQLPSLYSNIASQIDSSDCDKLACNFIAYVTVPESSADSTVNSCSLCSNCFGNANQLQKHLIEYHRVEVDKVASTSYY